MKTRWGPVLQQLVSGAAAVLLAMPISAAAANFSFQSNRGEACLPTLNSATPISGQGSCAIPFFSGSLNGTESIDERWRADFNGLGLAHDYLISGNATVGPWSVDAHTAGFATVGASDVLTITGGSGTGILRVGLDVHGSVSPPDGVFSSFVNTSINVVNANSGFFSGIGAFTLDIPFSYGSSFTLDRNLRVGWQQFGFHGGVGPWGPYGGSADYLNSADFSFAVLNDQMLAVSGAVITSDTGFVYLQATAVPEPASWALMMVGLIFVGSATRRRARPGDCLP